MKIGKPSRRGGEIFSLSFLDVICCGFGAMVLLVLLSKTGVVAGALDVDAVANLLSTLSAEQERKTSGEQERIRLSEETRRLEAEIRTLGASAPNLSALQQRLAELQAKARILQIQTGAPAGQTTPQAATDKIVKVGGIPVDSDHIIFIVDTSPSMQQIWERVIKELENVLDIHPKVKGFQIMNDNGTYLIKGSAGKWRPDTPRQRKAMLKAMRNWKSASSSSPVEGLEKALKTYAKRTEKLAIYIFGDDYSGSSYDSVLDTISKLNRSPAGDPLARIHGIGFQQQNGVANKFATLMREVTRRNRGAFIALGLPHKSTIAETNRPNRN